MCFKCWANVTPLGQDCFHMWEKGHLLAETCCGVATDSRVPRFPCETLTTMAVKIHDPLLMISLFKKKCNIKNNQFTPKNGDCPFRRLQQSTFCYPQPGFGALQLHQTVRVAKVDSHQDLPQLAKTGNPAPAHGQHKGNHRLRFSSL